MNLLPRLCRPIGVGLAALALVTGVGLLPASPAHAETRTTPDATGDPVRTTSDDAVDDGVETEAAPGAKRVDLVSTRYDYRRQVLVVRGTARAAGRAVQVTARVRAEGQDYYFNRAEGGRVQGYRLSPRDFSVVRCSAARSSVNPDRATYTMRIPAGCFGAPASARLGFAVSQDQEPGRRSVSSTQDDANRTGGRVDGFGDAPRLGEALRRGTPARTVPDAVGDAVRTTYSFDSGGARPAGEPAPRARLVDLSSTRFDYGRRFLVVTGTAAKAGRAVDAVLRVRAGRQEFFFFRARGDRIEGFGTARGSEGPAQCSGGSSQVDTDRGTYTLRVPAACFGSPASARFGFGLVVDRSTRRTTSTTVDDAQRDGRTTDLFGLALGAALARG